MLQFFKKSGRGTNNDVKSLPDNKTKRYSMASTTNLSQLNGVDTFLDDNLDNIEGNILETRSRLSMNLTEIVSDKNCLSYFIQFLETKNALSLIKFYLDTECFRTATERLYSTTEILKNCRTTAQPTAASSTPTTTTTTVVNILRERQLSKSTSSECSDKLSLNSSFDVSSDLISIDSQSIDILQQTDKCNNDDYLNVLVPDPKTSFCDFSMRKSITDDDDKSLNCTEQNSAEHKSQNNNININKSTNSMIATDAIRIYRKYLNSNSQYYIDLPATILSLITLELCGQEIDEYGNEITKIISSKCYSEAQQFAYERLDNDYLNGFLDSTYYCKYCIEILTNTSNLMLSDILHNESALFYFMEYLEQENQRNLLEFWLAAMNYRKHYVTVMNEIDDFNHIQAQTDAMILYEKYFSLQAKYPLKISNKIRSHIEECICSCDDQNTFIGHCFDWPLIIIEKYIEKYQFENFLLCQLFANYLNDLKSKIQDHKTSEWKSSVQRRYKHRKTMSDCSSLNFTNNNKLNSNYISQQNTLLAMESNNNNINGKFKNNKSVIGDNAQNMQIDSRQLTDPDLLWQRTVTGDGRLMFGRVNSLGRYERDFEMDTNAATASAATSIGGGGGFTTIAIDEKWSSMLAGGSSKIKNAVRKFVNLPEDKVQEEIAWQVAEMIVKDITSITLGNDNENIISHK